MNKIIKEIFHKVVPHTQIASTAHMEPSVHTTRDNVHLNNHKIKSAKACYITCNNALIFIKCAILTIHNQLKAPNKIDNSISL